MTKVNVKSTLNISLRKNILKRKISKQRINKTDKIPNLIKYLNKQILQKIKNHFIMEELIIS